MSNKNYKRFTQTKNFRKVTVKIGKHRREFSFCRSVKKFPFVIRYQIFRLSGVSFRKYFISELSAVRE